MNFTEILKAITEAHNNKGYNYFGVRTGDAAEVGQELECSHDWDFENDISSDELLTGTSSTGIAYLWFDGEPEDEEVVEKAVTNHLKSRYPGEMTYIIGGKRATYGDDEDELVIADAEVIYIVK